MLITYPRDVLVNYAAVASATAQIRQTLFSEGQQGALYYPKPMVDGVQVLWQQSDGTIVVDAHDHPVGRMDDLSTNDNHVLQVASAAKPLYRTDSTIHWLALDGAGDHIRSADFGLPHLHTVSVVFRPTAQGDFIIDGLTTNACSLWISNQVGLELQVRAFAGVSLYTSNTVTLNDWNIITAVFDGASSVVRLNGVEATGDTGTAVPDGVTLGWDGGMTNAVTSLAGRIAGAAVRTGRLSAGEIDELEGYLNDLVGGGVL